MKKVKSVDDYLAKQPEKVAILLTKLRKIVKSAAPLAEETISYGMPAYKYHGVIVYFSGCKKHMGFYPTSSGIARFKKELSKFETSKGTLKLPLDKELPTALIRKIVMYRVKENLSKLKSRKRRSNR